MHRLDVFEEVCEDDEDNDKDDEDDQDDQDDKDDEDDDDKDDEDDEDDEDKDEDEDDNNEDDEHDEHDDHDEHDEHDEHHKHDEHHEHHEHDIINYATIKIQGIFQKKHVLLNFTLKLRSMFDIITVTRLYIFFTFGCNLDLILSFSSANFSSNFSGKTMP